MPADIEDTGDVDGEGAPQGLSWSYELDFGALIAALAGADPPDAADTDAADAAGGPGAGTPAPGSAEEEAAQEAILDELAELDARAAAEGRVDGRVPLAAVAGRVAERLAPGPDLAAWLATAPPAGLDDGDLAAVAGSWRRVASWAQARELAAVAQMTSRAAARDEHAGTSCDGRPSQVTASAAAEVALELTMSQYGASAWADLAVQLSWRLAATGAALDQGVIDVPRARLIAEATGMLSDETARAVEERVLPAAGRQTTGMLRAALRRAVIAADPRGAEERRKDAERRAQVVLYPDQDCTATLAGQRLPAIHAAAAMARITAMAWALKASGAGGGIDLLRAQVFVGLLLGTMPLIPPAEGAPPDNPPPDNPPSGDPASGDPPGGPASGGPASGNPPAGDPAPGDPPPGDPPGSDGPPGDPGSAPRDDSGGGSDGDSGEGHPGDGRRHGAPPEDGVASDVPPPGDQDAPRPEDDYPCPDGPVRGARPGYSDGDHDDDGWLTRDWPVLPAVLPPAFAGTGSSRAPDGRPATGLLDVSLPWQVLAGVSAGPGYLGRIGPLPASQARHLARAAAGAPATDWRIIVTTPAGQALTVTRIPRARPPGLDTGRGPDNGQGPAPGQRSGTGQRSGPGIGPGAGIGLVGRVTLTIPEDILTHPPPWPEPGTGLDLPDGILARAIKAAATAAARARAAQAADAAAGGCAHAAASLAYRPPPRLKEYIAARDLTCRFPRCRQPAWRGDLDHTIAFDDGGLTCGCNLGGLCRTHHVLKHHPDWNLRQFVPGVFTWTTPAGRTYITTPDTHPL